jgi:hypothetical protein
MSSYRGKYLNELGSNIIRIIKYNLYRLTIMHRRI